MSWLALNTKGKMTPLNTEILKWDLETDYLSLQAEWRVAGVVNGSKNSKNATVKIFANENEFKVFNESKRNRG